MTSENEKLASESVQSDSELIASIERKLRAKTRNQECPFCENQNWFSLDVTSKTMAVIFESNSIDTYTLACTNCGFIRQHIKAIVEGEVEKVRDGGSE